MIEQTIKDLPDGNRKRAAQMAFYMGYADPVFCAALRDGEWSTAAAHVVDNGNPVADQISDMLWEG